MELTPRGRLGEAASGRGARGLWRVARWAFGAVMVASMCLACVSCAPRAGLLEVAREPVAGLAQGAPLTVIELFSAHCPCQRAHDARLLALYRAYSARGVRFVFVDSESDSSPSIDEAETRARGYPIPIVSDPDGAIAAALGAQYATFTVVLDGAGRVHFRGGIDSDRSHLTDDARPFLGDAIESLLQGREPEVPEAKTLGCALRR